MAKLIPEIDRLRANVRCAKKTVNGVMITYVNIDSAAPADKGTIRIKPAADTQNTHN